MGILNDVCDRASPETCSSARNSAVKYDFGVAVRRLESQRKIYSHFFKYSYKFLTSYRRLEKYYFVNERLLRVYAH